MKLLPIDEIIPELLNTVQTHSNILLHAPPGAGKTTRVPLTLLDIIPPEAGRILMLEPRRLAAVSAARWMSSCLEEEVGETVGYSIRFDSKTTSRTRIEVVTEGVLTRRIQHDPLLEGVAMVIFDEFHERSIQADLGLALCLDVQRQVRGDLKILVMSATLDVEPLARLMDNAPIVSSPGRSYPVEEIYLEEPGHSRLPQRMASAIQLALRENQGDILCFLPGAGEIKSCSVLLDAAGLSEKGIQVHQLYGDLPFDQQQRAIQSGKNRKIVLATSIAETSLTIEGVRVVIDCGLSRRMRHDQASGMNRLVTVRESKASAEQRKGRAGRVAPGVCYRLFSQHTYSAMTAHTPAEIMDMDLSPLLLEVTTWGISDPCLLTWLDPPPEVALTVARKLLIELNALDSRGGLTSLGRSMAGLPLHPRLSCLLVRSQELNLPQIGCDLAALLSERDIVRRSGPDHLNSGRFVDVVFRLELLHDWRSKGRCDAVADISALKAVDRISTLLARLQKTTLKTKPVVPDILMVARLLASSYPDRIARLRDGATDRYLLANGRGARLAAQGTISISPLLIAILVGGGEQGEGVIYLSAEITEETIREELAGQIEKHDNIIWDQREGRVVAQRDECIGSLILSSRTFMPTTEQQLPVVLKAVADSSLNLLTRDEAFLQLQARVMLMRSAFKELDWPDYSDNALIDTLGNWLAPYIRNATTSRQISAINTAAALLNQLDYRQRQELDLLAPTHLVVPSGSKIRIDYCTSDQPVLSVKLQELFGLAETPTVAGGRMAVLLYLLSPAGRPLQVTQDLKGFWDGSYHQVKKEMKGRYPKHPWPDDPWTALPTRRAKPKGT